VNSTKINSGEGRIPLLQESVRKRGERKGQPEICDIYLNSSHLVGKIQTPSIKTNDRATIERKGRRERGRAVLMSGWELLCSLEEGEKESR